MSIIIAPFTTKELAITDEVVKLAYNVPQSRKESLARYLALQPDGVFIAKDGESVVGFGAALDYGPFAYIGLMSVHPSHQKRGIGHLLMEHLLTWLESHGCATVLLDATSVGFPLYQHYGFSTDDTTIVLRRTNSTSLPTQPATSIALLQSEELVALTAFDAPYFGATRATVLSSYYADNSQRVLVARDMSGQLTGYLIAQPNVLGPWVTLNAEIAEQLLLQALTLPFASEPSVFTSAQNHHALHLLERYGFTPQRTLRHMRKGKPVSRNRHEMLYGQTSLGLG